MIGVAVASQELKILFSPDSEPIVVAYSQAGLDLILEKTEENEKVLIAGNRQWALAIAYALFENGRQARYLSSGRRQKGVREKYIGLLEKAMANNFHGKPFFEENRAPALPPEPHPWVELGNRYFLLMNTIRRIKHRIINNLRITCPEAVMLGEKLWTKRRFSAIKNCQWNILLDGQAGNSLARFIPLGKRTETEEEILKLCIDLETQGQEKGSLQAKIKALTSDHPVTSFFKETNEEREGTVEENNKEMDEESGGIFSANLLALFLGWRKWGTARNHPTGFRAIRHFAGLDVSRMDAKGKMRISRSRPNVRTAIYWALRSKKGKEITGWMKGFPRPKRIERLLLKIWQYGLRDGPSQ